MDQVITRESVRGHAKLQVSDLPFSAIPNQTRLFLEYQRDPLSLSSFYANASDGPLHISSYAGDMLSAYTTDRTDLCDALTEINSGIDAGDATFENIALLRDPDTVAVVTGQQAGMFTGPLYTIYKALSAVRFAEELCKSGTNAVPVFWAATEDHDFAEVSEAFFTDKTGALLRSDYTPTGYLENSPVGSVRIDGEIDTVIDQIFGALPETEFSLETRSMLAASWRSGKLFGEAFTSTLAVILRKYGIVFLDPMHPGIKNLVAPLYAAAVDKADDITSVVRSRNDDLAQAGFHAQVAVDDDYFPLFWHDDDGRRTALRKRGDGVYRAKDGQREFTTAELKKIAGDEPHRLSPGVMLRPVVQDFLLPTICYFGGAAEIAYFAQNSVVYRLLDRPVTPVFHRQSFTVVEAKHRRALEKYQLALPDLFGGLDDTMRLVTEKRLAPEMISLFADVEEKINTELNRLDQELSPLDPTLGANLAKRRRKIIYHLVALRQKSLLARARKDEIANRQIEGLVSALLPNGQLQERSLNIVTYLNKFGPGFIDWIYDAIDLEDKDHRIVDL